MAIDLISDLSDVVDYSSARYSAYCTSVRGRQPSQQEDTARKTHLIESGRDRSLNH